MVHPASPFDGGPKGRGLPRPHCDVGPLTVDMAQVAGSAATSHTRRLRRRRRRDSILPRIGPGGRRVIQAPALVGQHDALVAFRRRRSTARRPDSLPVERAQRPGFGKVSWASLDGQQSREHVPGIRTQSGGLLMPASAYIPSSAPLDQLEALARVSPQFRARLIEDPRAVMQSYLGVAVPEDVNVHVVEATDTDYWIVLMPFVDPKACEPPPDEELAHRKERCRDEP